MLAGISANWLVLRVKSRDRSIDKDQVQTVRANLRDLPRALLLVSRLGVDDVEGSIHLARVLEGFNLPSEARLLYWRRGRVTL